MLKDVCGSSVLWSSLSPSPQNYQVGSEKFHVKVVSKIYGVSEIKDNCSKNRWLLLLASYLYERTHRFFSLISIFKSGGMKFEQIYTKNNNNNKGADKKNTQLFDTFQGHAHLKMSFSTSRKVHLHFPKTGSLETPTGRTRNVNEMKLVRIVLVNK